MVFYESFKRLVNIGIVLKGKKYFDLNSNTLCVVKIDKYVLNGVAVVLKCRSVYSEEG
jgi:hypothetical protein